jgi:hypothetical protein
MNVVRESEQTCWQAVVATGNADAGQRQIVLADSSSSRSRSEEEINSERVLDDERHRDRRRGTARRATIVNDAG